MKAGFLAVAVMGLAASPALAKQETVVIAPTSVSMEQSDPAERINRAAELIEQGNLAEARVIYLELEQANFDYKLETTDGSWLFPAEIARRGMKEIAARTGRVNLAAAR